MLSSLVTIVWSRLAVNLKLKGVVEFCWLVDVNPGPIQFHREWQLLQELHTVVKAGMVCLGG